MLNCPDVSLFPRLKRRLGRRVELKTLIGEGGVPTLNHGEWPAGSEGGVWKWWLGSWRVYEVRVSGKTVEKEGEIEVGESLRKVHMAAGEAYDLDGHVKTQCTLYLFHASFSAPPICVRLSPSLFLCGFSPSAFPSSTSSLFLPAALQLPLFSASSSTYYALFSECEGSVATKRAAAPLCLPISPLSLFFSVSLSLANTHARSCTHPSMEIEIMIMYPSVCIKV